MTTRTVGICGLGVDITAADTTFAVMDDYIGHLPTTPTRRRLELRLDVDPLLVDARCRVWRDRTPHAVRHSHPALAYRQWHDAGRRVLIPEHGPLHVITVEGRRIRIVATSHNALATVAVRVLRQAIMRWAEHNGGGSLHAGAVVLDGRAVLIGGSAGAGKTAVVTSLAEHYAAAPIANDRVVVLPGQPWTVAGVPLAWRVTPEGVDASPQLSLAVAEGRLRRGVELVERKVEFTPAEVATYLRTSIVPSAPVDQLVVLVRHGHPHIDHPETANLLRAQVGFGDHDQFADDWLGLRQLLAGAGGLAVHPHARLWARLADSLPVTVYTWSDPSQLPDIAATVAGRR